MLDDSNVNKYNRLANSSTHMFTQKPATLNINTLIELRTHNFAINIYLLFAYIHRQKVSTLRKKTGESFHGSLFEPYFTP